MKFLNYFRLFLGIAKLEAKKNAGEEIFKYICEQLPSTLDNTNDEQISYFKSYVLPQLSKEDIVCLKEYLNWMINYYQSEFPTTAQEEQHLSKWGGIYLMFLEALPETKE